MGHGERPHNPDASDPVEGEEAKRPPRRRPRLDVSLHESWDLDPFDPLESFDDFAGPAGRSRDDGPRVAPERIVALEVPDTPAHIPRRLRPRWILGSLTLHALITTTLLLTQRFGADEAPPPSELEVYNVSIDAIPADLLPVLPAGAAPPEEAPPQEQARVKLPSGQVVRLAPPPTPQAAPAQARYLAADNHQTTRETRARDWQVNPDVVASRASKEMREEVEGGKQQVSGGGPEVRERVAMVPRTPERTTPDRTSQGLPPEATGDLPGAGEAEESRSQRRKLNLFPHPGQVAALLGGGGPGSSGYRLGSGGPRSGAPDNDALDVPEGDETRLNAQRFAWEKFFSALRRQFNYYYTEASNNLGARDIDQRVFEKSYVTAFTVTFMADGKVDDVRVLRSSGVDAFDDLVVTALRNGSPFPKPPAELLDAEGRLTIPGECRLGVGMGVPSFSPGPRYGRR